MSCRVHSTFSLIFTFSDNYDYTDYEEFDVYDADPLMMNLGELFDSPGDEKNVDQASSGEIVESIPTRVRLPETWLLDRCSFWVISHKIKYSVNFSLCVSEQSSNSRSFNSSE